MTQFWHEWELCIFKIATTVATDLTYYENDTKLVLTNLGQMALILLNYRYSPNGHIGVNASIRPHSTEPSALSSYSESRSSLVEDFVDHGEYNDVVSSNTTSRLTRTSPVSGDNAFVSLL